MEGVGYSVSEQLMVGLCGCGKAEGGYDSTRPTSPFSPIPKPAHPIVGANNWIVPTVAQ
jgi:hypothetical protein